MTTKIHSHDIPSDDAVAVDSPLTPACVRTTIKSVLLILPLCLAVGCDKKADEKQVDEKQADDKKTQVEAPPAEKPAEPEPPAAEEMKEHDLTSAGADWAGWSAQGPATAEVMSDLGKAARIAGDKDSEFDLLFKPKKTDLAESKAKIEKRAAANGTKVTFTTDTPELIEWTTEGEGWTSYGFEMNMTASEREVTCKSLRGDQSTAARDVHKTACGTLAKKE